MRASSVRVSKVSLLSLLVALGGACGGGSGGAAPSGAGGTRAGAAGSSGAAGTSPTTGAGGTTPAAGEAGTVGSSGAAGTGAAGSSATGAAGDTGAAGTQGGTPDAGVDAPGGKGGTGASKDGGAGTSATGQGGSTGGAAGGSAGTTGGAAGSSGVGNFPARFAAPYVETWSQISLTNLATATGHKFYTLAFVIGGNGCAATLNGDTAIGAETFYAAQVTNLRKMGGDVIVSFGGASGTELGDACTTVDSLQAAYQSVITKYGLKWMDLDIEGGAESRTAAVDRRNKALKNLQTANPGLHVSYTLAVDPTGLPQAQRNLLANAKTNGVRVDTVNVMAMDYGACNLDMGKAAIMAADATRGQIQTLGTSSAVGVTPMIGVNDTTCENFTTANATALVTYAQDNAYINLLAFWAEGADNGHAYLNIFKTLH